MAEEVPIVVDIPALHAIDDEQLRARMEVEIRDAVRRMLADNMAAQERIRQEADERVSQAQAVSAVREAQAEAAARNEAARALAAMHAAAHAQAEAAAARAAASMAGDGGNNQPPRGDGADEADSGAMEVEDAAVPPSNPTISNISFDKAVVERKFNGEGWYEFSYQFELMATAAGIWELFNGTIDVPGNGASMRTLMQFKKTAMAAFAILNRNCTVNIQQQLKKFKEDAHPPRAGWEYLMATYQSKTSVSQVTLLHQLSTLTLQSGEKFEAYLNRAKALRDQLSMVDNAVPESLFVTFILKGLTAEWANLKQSLRFIPPEQLTEKYVTQILMNEQRQKELEQKDNPVFLALPSPGAGRGGGRGRGRGEFAARGRGAGRGRGRGRGFGRGRDQEKPTCYHCGKVGHVWIDCRTRPEGWRPSDTPTQQPLPNADVHAAEALVTMSGLTLEPAAFVTSVVRATNGIGMVQPATSVGVQTGVSYFTQECNAWLLDSGSSMHVTKEKEWLTPTALLSPPAQIKVGNNAIILAPVMGEVMLKGCSGTLLLQRVLYCPEIAANLLSLTQLMRVGVQLRTSQEKVLLSGPEDFTAYGVITDKGLIQVTSAPPYPTRPPSQHQHVFKVTVLPDLMLWHRRLGHFNVKYVERTMELVQGMSPAPKVAANDHCTDCVSNKLAMSTFKPRVPSPAKPLDLVHSDICGPVPPSAKGHRYFVAFIDEATRYCWAEPMVTRDEVLSNFTTWKAAAENQVDRRLKVFRADGAGEYTSNDFKALRRVQGFSMQYCAPYFQQQNGVSERFNRTFEEGVLSMLSAAELPRTYWTHALAQFVWCKNRVASASLPTMTPYEAWHGRRPSVAQARVFGCMALFYIPKDKRRKWGERAQWGLHLGISSQHKAWVFESLEGNIIITPTAFFLEAMTKKQFHELHNNHMTQLKELLTAASEKFLSLEDGDANSQGGSNAAAEPGTTLHDAVLPEEAAQHDSGTTQEEAGVRDNSATANTTRGARSMSDNAGFAPPQKFGDVMGWDGLVAAVSDDILVEDEADEQQMQMQVTNAKWSLCCVLLAATAEGVLGEIYVDSLAALVPSTSDLPPEPQSLKEALEGPHADRWMEAIKAEWDAIMERGTFTLEMLPPGKRPVGCKWVFKVKTHPDGSLKRWKARLVAQGFTQIEGVDFRETYAPVSRFTTFRVLSAIAAAKDLHVQLLDVKNAFLYGDLDTVIYMKQPPLMDDGSGRVCKLVKSLYGLKQAPLVWYQTLGNTLAAAGWRKSQLDWALYIKNAGADFCWVLLYVDDIMVVASTGDLLQEAVRVLKGNFDMSLLPFETYLGMNLSRDIEKGDISLSQTSYINRVWGKYEDDDIIKACSTGRVPTTPLSTTFDDPASAPWGATAYRALVGSLMFVSSCTRPDMTLAVSRLAQHNKDPRMTDFYNAVRCLHYLVSTKQYGLTFTRGGDLQLHGFCDANHVKTGDCKSTSGYVFLLGGAAVSWSSKKQSVVAKSSCEAEYIAANTAASEAVYLRMLLAELGITQHGPTQIACDSGSAVALTKTDQHHDLSKHIHLKYRWVRAQVEAKEVEFYWVRGDQQAADFLTKPLLPKEFSRCRSAAGLSSTSSAAQGGGE
jgi:hypothetical protein